MEAAAYAEMHALEDHHWWFRGRRRRVAPILREALSRAPRREDPLLVEVGCGTGGNLVHLARRHAGLRSVGLDLDAGALSFCRSRGLEPLLRADGTRLPLEDGCVDCVLALDIIEHFEDDGALLAELRRVLRPGGQLVATVPQYPRLWSPHDEFLHHVRRYAPRELEGKLTRAGFEVRRRLGFNFLLLPPIALVRLLKSARARREGGRAGGTDFFELPRPLNWLMGGFFAAEALIARALPFAPGVSLLVRAERTR